MNTPPLTQTDLLALLRRTTDEGWLNAMLAQPDGLAVINAWLAIFAKASEAVSGQVDCSMISTAPAGRCGVCTLTLQRTDTTASATIPKGYTFVTNLGVELTVACDVQIAVGQSTVALPLVTTRQIDLVNTPGPAFDDILKPGGSLVPILGLQNQSTSYAWSPTGSLTTARDSFASVTLPNGDIWVCGGRDSNGVVLASCERWIAATMKWADASPLGSVVCQHAAVLLSDNETVVIIGGSDDPEGGFVTNSVILHNIVTGTETQIGMLLTARRWHTATMMGGVNVLVAGGWSNSLVLDSCEILNVVTGESTYTANSLTIGREFHTATLLADQGVVAIVGGYSGSSRSPIIEYVDVSTHDITTVGSFPLAARFGHATVAAPQGGLYLIGGNSVSGMLADMVYFDPVAKTLTTTEAALLTPRWLHAAATTSPNLGILVVGGQDGAYVDLASAEIFSDFVLSLAYVSSTPITGAVEDWLSALGNERGCIRQDGEDGEAYRARVRMIPDAVSPLAIARAVDATATALPERWLAEPFNDGADPNVKLAANLGFFDGFFCDADFCDDPLGAPLADKQPVANLECSGIRESRAYVRVDLVGQLREPDGSVLYCDDGFCDDPQWGYPDIGTHPAISGAEQALLQEVQGKLAGGVQFDVYLENSTALVQQGSLSGTTGIDGVPVITLMPVDGTAWYLREGLLTADMGPTQHWTVTGQGIAVRLTLDDGTILQTPWAQGVVSLRSYELEALGYRGQRVTSIEGWGLTLTPLVPGSPGNTMNLIGSFTVNACTL